MVMQTNALLSHGAQLRHKLFGWMRRHQFYLLTSLLLLSALAMRIYFFLRQGGQIHPDEVFQYLEPAQWKIFGYGHLSWEFDKGARNFALSGFYSHFLRLGAWLQLRPFAVHRALFFLDAMLSLALVPAMWRLGAKLQTRRFYLAWLLAFTAAIFPVFSYFAPHTLSESHVVILLAWGNVLWFELAQPGSANEQFVPSLWSKQAWWSKQAFAAGLLLGLAFIIRYAAAVFLVIPGLYVLLSPRRYKALAFYAGLILPTLIIAAVDWYAWGFPLATFVHYVDKNVIHGYAATHGRAPWWYYFAELRTMFGPAVYLVAAGLFVALFKRPRLTLAALLPLFAYGFFAHKEMRFLLPVFPLIIAASLYGLDVLWQRLCSYAVCQKMFYVYAFTILIVFFWRPLNKVQTWSKGQNRGFFTALDYVGRQADARGLLIDTTRSHTGGYTLLRRNIPFAFAYGDLIGHRAYNYVAVTTEGMIRYFKGRQDFALVGMDQGVFLFRRKDR